MTLTPQDNNTCEIQTTDWENASSSYDPFKYTYSTNNTRIREINESTKVELRYGNPVQFAKYGFSVLDITNYYPVNANVVYTEEQNIYRLNGDLYMSDDYGLNWYFVPYTTTEPGTPVANDLWLDGTTLYKYVSGEWVEQTLINISVGDYWYKNDRDWYTLYRCDSPTWVYVGYVEETETTPSYDGYIWYQPSTGKMFRHSYVSESWVEISCTTTKSGATVGTYYYDAVNQSVEEYQYEYNTVNYQTEKQEYAQNGDLWIEDLGNGNYKLYEWKSNQRAIVTFGAINKPTETVRLTIDIYYNILMYPWSTNGILA